MMHPVCYPNMCGFDEPAQAQPLPFGLALLVHCSFLAIAGAVIHRCIEYCFPPEGPRRFTGREVTLPTFPPQIGTLLREGCHQEANRLLGVICSQLRTVAENTNDRQKEALIEVYRVAILGYRHFAVWREGAEFFPEDFAQRMEGMVCLLRSNRPWRDVHQALLEWFEASLANVDGLFRGRNTKGARAS